MKQLICWVVLLGWLYFWIVGLPTFGNWLTK
ncbi:putative membrane protein [Burkholderia humptydooensis]|nr:putative membrane protein [Burkholderia sp. 2002721687]